MSTNRTWKNFEARLAGQSELGAVWWDLRFASLITHLLFHHTVVWGYLVYCFFCLFVRLRISQRRKKDSGVQLRTLVRLLSGQVFSNFSNFWLA